MSFKPPHARMRAIKRAARPVSPFRGQPAVASVEEALARVEEALPREPVAPTPVEKDDDSIVAETIVDEVPAPVVAPPSIQRATPIVEPAEEASIVTEPVEEAVPSLDEDEEIGASLEMKRSELNALAVSLGVESPEKLPNKQAVVDAIAGAPQSI